MWNLIIDVRGIYIVRDLILYLCSQQRRTDLSEKERSMISLLSVCIYS
jgi:hypothetical protein